MLSPPPPTHTLHLQAARPAGELRVVVMSATLEAAKFTTYLPGAKAALIHGRTFPVQLFYTAAPEESYLDGALNAALQVHADEGPGDILVFLTGQDEIESLERLLAVGGWPCGGWGLPACWRLSASTTCNYGATLPHSACLALQSVH